jgi:hypothetical protein
MKRHVQQRILDSSDKMTRDQAIAIDTGKVDRQGTYAPIPDILLERDDDDDDDDDLKRHHEGSEDQSCVTSHDTAEYVFDDDDDDDYYDDDDNGDGYKVDYTNIPVEVVQY